jgi:hypothetical protein
MGFSNDNPGNRLRRLQEPAHSLFSTSIVGLILPLEMNHWIRFGSKEPTFIDPSF